MKLTHVNDSGNARMVDISDKKMAPRMAVAEGKLLISEQTAKLIRKSNLPKGNPFEVARIAAIQAAKQTNQLIPLCHPLALDFVNVDIKLQEDGFLIRSRVRCRWTTGVEMEALTAVSMAALTLYDMCKAVDKEMVIGDIRLLEKTKGGSD